MDLKKIYTNSIYIVVIIGIVISLYYTKNYYKDITKLLNILVIIILTTGFIVSLLFIKTLSIPIGILQQFKISEYGAKAIIFFVLLTTYISIIQIPIKNLSNKSIIIKTPLPGNKGIRGPRGSQGNDGICTKCSDNDLCYKKILYNITLTYNWWRKFKGLPLYSDSYIIKNEFIKSRVKIHCKSPEFSKIYNKYGANTDTNMGAYDYMFKMWSIWILIILKYDKGSFFLESEQLDEKDFVNMIDKKDKNNNLQWNDMFIDSNIKITKNLIESEFEYSHNNTINESFFTTKGVPNENESPFDEIKRYSSWYWGNDNSKPIIDIISNINEEDNALLYKTCYNEKLNELPKIKIKKTNNFYKLFSTDNADQIKDDELGTYKPFQQLGSSKITFMRSHEYVDNDEHPKFRTYKPVGDVVFESYKIKKYPFESGQCKPNNIKYSDKNIDRIVPKDISSILVSGDVKHPIRYEEVYKLLPARREGINKNIVSCTVWKPIPPSGYVALGYIIDTTPYKDSSTEEERMPSTDIMVCVPKDIVDNTEELKRVWNSNDILTNIHKLTNSNDIYPLNTFKINGEHYKIKSDLKGYLCQPFNPKNPDHQTITEIYNECTKHKDNEQFCKASSKCEWKDSKCDYKNRSNDDIKKYSIMKIYENL